MERKVYYFSREHALADFAQKCFDLSRSNESWPVNGCAEHYQSYAEAWAKTSHPSQAISQLGIGSLDKKINAPGVAIIYGEQVSPLFTWARQDPQQYVGEVQHYNIINATVHFGADVLHNSDFIQLHADANGVIDYRDSGVETYRRYRELKMLATAVDKTSEQCRRSLNMDNTHDVMRLRNIYGRAGDCRLQTPDLLSRLIVSATEQLKEKLSLEFTLHIPEFQQKAQELYFTHNDGFPSPPQSPVMRAINAIADALEWLEDTVQAENMCTSAEVWSAYRSIHQEFKGLEAGVQEQVNTSPSVFLVEHRSLEQLVNVGVDVHKPLPTFESWAELQQFMHQCAFRQEKENPSNTGYFMIYHGYTQAVQPMMAPVDVSLTDTSVYMLGNGIFAEKSCCVTQGIVEQEMRMDTWNAVKDFAATHNLNWKELCTMPVQQMQDIRNAFEPGGILENGYMIESAALGHQELKPLRDIQRLLTGEHATWDTVRASMLIEQSYTTNLQQKLDEGMPMQEAVRQEMLFALKDAEHYTHSDPSMAQNDALCKIFYNILEAHWQDADKDVAELLEWYADGCLEEFEVEDV